MKVFVMKNKILSAVLMTLCLSGTAMAEHEAGHVVFNAATNMLMMPEVHVVDANGNETAVYKVHMVLTGGEAPKYTFEVSMLDAVAPMHRPPEGGVMPSDKDGCIAPETWHAAMNHCMVQK